MENILKKNSERAERLVLAYVIAVVMVFGSLNPLTSVADRNTAREISGMGKVVNMDIATLPSGNTFSGGLSQKISMMTMEKNILGKLSSGRNFADLCGVENIKIEPIAQTKNSLPEGKSIVGKTNMAYSDRTVVNPDTAITVPDTGDYSDTVPGIIEQPIAAPIADNDDVIEEPVYIEISGMKIDSQGYVTEILSGAPDGVLAFPTDVRCKGIRSDVFERSDSSLKREVEEVYIPANIVYMDDGIFDCLKNVDFIQAAKENPAYYSEAGILYHADGSLACMPQARIRD